MTEYERIQAGLKQIQDKLMECPQVSQIDIDQPCVDCAFCVTCRDEKVACEEFARWAVGHKWNQKSFEGKPRILSKKWMKNIGQGRPHKEASELIGQLRRKLEAD